MLETTINGIKFKNPVIAASGTFGFGAEFSGYFDVSLLGGIASKGLTLNPREGNAGQRMLETPSGMLNSVGLQNPGLRAFVAEELPRMKKYRTNIIANLSGSCEGDYLAGAEILDDSGIDMIELNISCPNVKSGGMAFGIKADVAAALVSAVRRKVRRKPLMVKLSPNAENIAEMGKACEAAGADSLSLVNTFSGLAINIYTRKPFFENVIAGLSGPAIKPLALRMVRDVYKAVKIPVVGMGGIAGWTDAAEFIMAGASLVQVGTANFTKPDICLDIIRGLERFLAEQNITSPDELRGII
ncbi:MAG: dihydroorotate dehydrogenase [Oscillospiraceae bacterium]|jgi:dihydroorotate dehydrogenase (NAD+) catalytic subunit|nr:dihydroorotate dehydrogenase [Oscillospiraceae bacterium]